MLATGAEHREGGRETQRKSGIAPASRAVRLAASPDIHHKKDSNA